MQFLTSIVIGAIATYLVDVGGGTHSTQLSAFFVGFTVSCVILAIMDV